MARSVTRQTLKLFGTSGASGNFGQFGSAAASAPVNTKTISTIQALSAWLNGWQSAVALGQAPYLEDMNSFCYVMAYMQYYMLQEGVAEWDSGTTYFIGSVVKSVANSGYVEFYSSLTDANTNNALPTRTNNSSWQFMYAMDTTNGLILGTLGANLVMGSHKITGLSNGTASGDAAAYGQLHMLQAPVYAEESTGGTTTSASFVAMGASASITPVSASSKILMWAGGTMNIATSTDAAVGVIGFGQGGTQLFAASAGSRVVTGSFNSSTGTVVESFYSDAPGATTAKTYQTMIASDGTHTVNYGATIAAGMKTRILLMEVI